jgi:hypothetical protein
LRYWQPVKSKTASGYYLIMFGGKFKAAKAIINNKKPVTFW